MSKMAVYLLLLIICALAVGLGLQSGPPFTHAAVSTTKVSTSVAPQFDQAKALEELRKQIADKANEPAEKVFKNLQRFKTMPAGRLLAIMEIGYAKSLGVNCTHCHVAGEWEKEDKPAKQIAREMAEMSAVISNDLLKKIKNLKSERPVVNCTTCHRGQLKPALNLP